MLWPVAMDGAEPRLEGLRTGAVTLDAVARDDARLGFHRSYPKRSANRVLFATQVLAAIVCLVMFAWALRAFPSPTLSALHLAALVLFAVATFWRLLAASKLTPELSRLAEPQI